MSSEHAARVRRFDSYVSSVEQTMRHPTVVARLGDLAAKVTQVNERAFLPNIRRGRLVVPRKHRADGDALAIVPLSRDEAAHASKLVESITATTYGDWKKLGERVESTVSGANMDTVSLLNWLETEDDRDAPVHSTRLSSRAIARTMVGYTLGEDAVGGRYYAASRPVCIVDGGMLDGLDAWNQAAVIGHEEAHARDLVESPLLYTTPCGGMASEFVGYRLTATLHSMTSQEAEGQELAREVEQWRQQHLGATNYAPNDEQISLLRQERFF